MPENLLTLLNYLLLVLLYLFFARVLWTVWSEVKTARPAKPADANPPVLHAPPAVPPAAATAVAAQASSKAGTQSRKRKTTAARRAPPSRLVVVEPADRAGSGFDLTSEMTLGRAAGCHVSIPTDTYASSLHARVYEADGLTMVEDLGSTNGTFVNGERISGPTAVKVGDTVKVGATVLEVA